MTRRSLLSERYQKGAEMLGSEILLVRLGGVYSLQRLAENYRDSYHVQVIRLLCAFVRHPKEDEGYETMLAERNADPKTFYLLREDVQAIMNWIGSRDEAGIALEKDAEFELDLKGTDLVHGQFIHANLAGALLQESNLSHANISRADLSGAYLNHAILKDARLYDVDLTDVRGWKVDLSGSRMRDVIMPGGSLDNWILSNAVLQTVDLSGATIQRTNFSDSQIKADLSGSSLLDVKLIDAHLDRSDMSGATIFRTNMSGAWLRDVNLSGTYFYDPHGGTAASPVTGLTQAQLDAARADPDNPPKLDGVLDAETGEQLVWRGRPVEPPLP